MAAGEVDPRASRASLRSCEDESEEFKLSREDSLRMQLQWLSSRAEEEEGSEASEDKEFAGALTLIVPEGAKTGRMLRGSVSVDGVDRVVDVVLPSGVMPSDTITVRIPLLSSVNNAAGTDLSKKPKNSHERKMYNRAVGLDDDDESPLLLVKQDGIGECYAAYSMKGSPPRAKRWEKKLGMRVDAQIAGKTIGTGRAAANWKEQNNATDRQLSAEIKKAQQLSDEVNKAAREAAEEAKRVELAANPPRATALERKIGMRIDLKVGGKTFGSGAAVNEWYQYNPDKDLLEAIETAHSAAQAAEEEAAAAAAAAKAQREAAREMAGSAAAQAQRVAEEKAKEREELAKEAARAAKAALAEAQAAHREWKTEAEKEHDTALAEAERELQEKKSELKARASQQDAEDEEEAEIAAESAELAAAGKALAASMAKPQASGLEKKLGMRIDLGGLGTGGAYQEWRKEWSNTLDEKKQSPQSSFERTKSAMPEASALEKKLGMRVDLPGVGTGGAYNSWKREEEKKMSPGSSFERTRSMVSGPANPMNEGHGKYVYASGDVYEGQFHDNLPHGIGKYTFVSGNVYDGEWKENQKHGKARFTFADGEVDIKCYEENRPVGEGVRWSTDRMQAWELQDGKPGSSISLDEAAAIAGRIGLAVPA